MCINIKLDCGTTLSVIVDLFRYRFQWQIETAEDGHGKNRHRAIIYCTCEKRNGIYSTQYYVIYRRMQI